MIHDPWSNVVHAIQLALPDAAAPWSHFDTIGLRFAWARVDVLHAYHRTHSPWEHPWQSCQVVISLADGRSFSLPIPLPLPGSAAPGQRTAR